MACQKVCEHANMVRIMHESEGQHIGKALSHIFFTLQSDSVFECYLIATYEANIPSYTDTNAGSYSSIPGHVRGARKWPENEATAVKWVNL